MRFRRSLVSPFFPLPSALHSIAVVEHHAAVSLHRNDRSSTAAWYFIKTRSKPYLDMHNHFCTWTKGIVPSMQFCYVSIFFNQVEQHMLSQEATSWNTFKLL
jgi:hypothetical protein